MSKEVIIRYLPNTTTQDEIKAIRTEFNKEFNIDELTIEENVALSLDLQSTKDKERVNKIFEMICSNSIYAFQEELANGFITIPGGHRIGLTGKPLYKDGKIKDRYKVKYNSTDINAITKRIAEIPITPQEAILRTQGNCFPVTQLNERLNQIDNNPAEFNGIKFEKEILN